MKKWLVGVATWGLLCWGASPVGAVSLERLTLYGFLDLEYEKADGPGNTDPTQAVGDVNGSFDQYHFNLLMGFEVTDRVSVKGHLEYEHGPQMPDTGEVNLEWAYVEYQINDRSIARGGLALTPFGLYNEIHDATPTFMSVRIPWEIYKTASIGGVPMFPKLNTGLFASGQYGETGRWPIDYTVYVGNGETETSTNPAERDDNRSKAIGAKIMTSPMAGITLGGSYYQGEKQLTLTTAADHIAWGSSADLTIGKLGLRAEFASSVLADVRQRGWYGEAFYSIALAKTVSPYVRIGAFDPNTTVGGDRYGNVVAGLNVQIERGLVLKGEWRHVSGSPGNVDVNQDYNEVGAAITVAF